MIPNDPTVYPAATKNANSDKSLGKEFTMKFN